MKPCKATSISPDEEQMLCTYSVCVIVNSRDALRINNCGVEILRTSDPEIPATDTGIGQEAVQHRCEDPV